MYTAPSIFTVFNQRVTLTGTWLQGNVCRIASRRDHNKALFGNFCVPSSASAPSQLGGWVAGMERRHRRSLHITIHATLDARLRQLYVLPSFLLSYSAALNLYQNPSTVKQGRNVISSGGNPLGIVSKHGH